MNRKKNQYHLINKLLNILLIVSIALFIFFMFYIYRVPFFTPSVAEQTGSNAQVHFEFYRELPERRGSVEQFVKRPEGLVAKTKNKLSNNNDHWKQRDVKMTDAFKADELANDISKQFK